MRIVIMGTGPFAVPSARFLQQAHEIPMLFTQPERARRGRGPAPPQPMRDWAAEAGIPIEPVEDINAATSHDKLRVLNADLFMVCDFGQILSAATLELARLGGINLHGSLLPKYRGAAPVVWALLEGETETGVTVIHMTPRLDAGPSLVQQKLTIEREENAAQLEHRLAELGVDAVREAIEMLEAWDQVSPLGTVQPEAQRSRAPRLRKSDGHLDWSHTAEQLFNRVRAFQPWPGCYTFLNAGRREPVRLIVEQVRVIDSPQVEAAPGTVLPSAPDGALWVATGDGRALAIEAVRPAGKRKMDSAEFLRGVTLPPDARCD